MEKAFVLLAVLSAYPPIRLPAQSPQPTISLSQNPVRSGTVTLRWTPAGTGPAQVAIYSLLGTPVAAATLDPDPGRWVWDARVQGAGLDAANGAYLIVVTRGDGRKLRRRIIVEH